ncbi:uncharacterized protein N7479_005188 [Penicillium vulpinum]|uniref:Uncharacterized protein n=1 Tax=Penicillium vulpinum TaxID=29845 RepID=A0A1V6RF78_9EURO|nr:uncharacterized protein N7479_005188 [Penicillium vulpinum]KAJ5958038.1 hypothetical protein N7479_005188 [Penicillium vulpinum]OQE00296.1 hypothetical protein PENVUL_c054G08712 [Penicillium vulpinum]
MEYRASIIGQIHGVMRDFLNSFDSSTPVPAIRIVGETPNSILDHSEFLKSIGTIVDPVQKAVAACCPDVKTRWIAVKKFEGRRSFFVLDLNNVGYDYATAHKCLTKVPVYILRLSKKPKIFRHGPQDQKLTESLAEMHNLHGERLLPLFDDYTGPRVYESPRYLRA